MSQFAATTERKFYVTTGVCTITWNEDYFRQNALCLPVGAIAMLLWLGLGFEALRALIKINSLVLLLFGAHHIHTATLKMTNDFVFQNSKVARGPCHSCGAQEHIYFGDS